MFVVNFDVFLVMADGARHQHTKGVWTPSEPGAASVLLKTLCSRQHIGTDVVTENSVLHNKIWAITSETMFQSVTRNTISIRLDTQIDEACSLTFTLNGIHVHFTDGVRGRIPSAWPWNTLKECIELSQLTQLLQYTGAKYYHSRKNAYLAAETNPLVTDATRTGRP